MNKLFTLFLSVLFIFSLNLKAQTITLDLNKSYQTIGHWENGGFLQKGLEELIIDDLVDLTVDSLGINRLRLEIRSGSENTVDYYQQYQDSTIEYETWRSNRYATENDDDDPNNINWRGFYFTELDETIENVLIPIRNRLIQNKSNLYINLCIVAFTGQLNEGTGGTIIHQIPEEYAEFIEAIFKHMENKYGFVPDAVEVLLEPDVAKFGDGKLVGECLVAAGNRLKGIGYKPDFIACSNTNLFNATGKMYSDFIKVPGVSEYWSEYSFHAYAGRTDDNLIQISENAKVNGVNTSMLEWWTNGHRYDYLHKCLKLANVSSYEFKGSFGTVNNDWSSGLLSIRDNGNNEYLLDLQPPVKYFRHYFKLISNGAVRYEAISDSSSFDPVVFKNEDGSLILNIMAANSGNVSISGLPTGSYQTIYSLGDGRNEPSKYWVKVTRVNIKEGEDYTLDIPSQGIFSVVQTNSPVTSIKESTNEDEEFTIDLQNGIININASGNRNINNVNIYTTNGKEIFSSSYKNVERVNINSFNFNKSPYLVIINNEILKKVIIK